MSWLGIASSIVGSAVVGTIWYSPPVFGKKWASYAYPGKKMDEIGKDGMCAFIPTMAANTFLMLILSHLASSYMGVKTIGEAVNAGMGLALFACLLQIPHFSYANRPWGLYVIDQGYDVVIILLGMSLMFFFQ